MKNGYLCEILGIQNEAHDVTRKFHSGQCMYAYAQNFVNDTRIRCVVLDEALKNVIGKFVVDEPFVWILM